MAKFGVVDYPDMPLTTALQYLSRAQRVLTEGITTDGLAQALELKPKTGGAARVLFNLKRYGLIDGRGTVKLTDLSKQILQCFTQDDRDKAKAHAWLRVEIVKALYERYGSDVPNVSGEFLALLSKISGAEPGDVQAKAKEIHDLYEEATKDLRALGSPSAVGTSTVARAAVATTSEVGPEPLIPVSPMGVVDAKVGDVYIRIPKTAKGLATATKLLELLSMQVGAEASNTETQDEHEERL